MCCARLWKVMGKWQLHWEEFHARMTTKGGGWLIGRKRYHLTVLALAQRKMLREFKSPSHTYSGLWGRPCQSTWFIWTSMFNWKSLGPNQLQVVGSNPTLSIKGGSLAKSLSFHKKQGKKCLPCVAAKDGVYHWRHEWRFWWKVVARKTCSGRQHTIG